MGLSEWDEAEINNKVGFAMKINRQKKIIEIIESGSVDTQDELIGRLKKDGFDVTQATISRDIKELGIVKTSTKDNRYKYSLPHVSRHDNRRISEKYKAIIRETVIKVDYAINTVVVNTYPGMAQAAAAAIDGIGNENMIGSLAGDDTIFVIMRNEKMAKEFTDKFKLTLDFV